MSDNFTNDLDHLTTGGEEPFLPNLLAAINSAIKIDITVAFIRSTGLELIYSALEDALHRQPPAQIRILTGDYLNVTEPNALRRLLLLQELGAETKIYETTPNESFHMKSYIFVEQVLDGVEQGCAYIGSSNISKMALKQGLEWNLRIDSFENINRFIEIRHKFEALYNSEKSKRLNHQWIDSYQQRYLANQNNVIAIIEQEPDEVIEPPPTPNAVQLQALDALLKTREEGYKRGLVVLATGMGKTWLSAFDAKAMNAKRVLFVAHREEILNQAEATYLKLLPDAKIGRYTGKQQEVDIDMLFASVQTLGKSQHLGKFDSDYFDYVVVDEFHHAAARTYKKLLAHFKPRFLLGLTATPERTDQVDILHLCDDNLVFGRDLFDGVNSDLLCPFHYHGIADDQVNYQELPWRNGKFDPEALVNQLATQARARHALQKWSELKQKRTLAFCVSQRHADFMADYFNTKGVKSVSVHSESSVRRNEALKQLTENTIDVLFSVDLFNEGVDIPSIDTVLMLRPTESKILFLQQLGRGMRLSEATAKTHLVIVDFIGNHISFFKKPEALFKIEANNASRKKFIKQIDDENLSLPEKCFVNYDVKSIDFMRELIQTRIDLQLDVYRGLREGLNRRPTLSEFFMGGGSVTTVRREHEQWLNLVLDENDLSDIEKTVFKQYAHFFREIEVTQMTKSFKMILLEAFIELNGFVLGGNSRELAARSFEILQRRRQLLNDLPSEFGDINALDSNALNRWLKYWRKNPIAAWIGENRTDNNAVFKLVNDMFAFKENVTQDDAEILSVLAQELIDFKLSQYEARSSMSVAPAILQKQKASTHNVPFFSDLKIACGYFRSSTHDSDNIEYRDLPLTYGVLDPAKHFVAAAKGDSMDGGKHPIYDGDYLLLELISSTSAGSISNQIMAIETQDDSGDDQYLLRNVKKRPDGGYDLVANNPDYPVFQANDTMRTFARLKSVISPLDMALHKHFMREDIPPLFGHVFNTGSWQSGHVSIKDDPNQYLFVTLNKQGKLQEHQYHDYFKDEQTFHWQSQNSAEPNKGKGKRIIEHEKNDSHIYLFVRKNKLEGSKAAPFIYCGELNYKSHNSEKPMNVEWQLESPLSKELFEYFSI